MVLDKATRTRELIEASGRFALQLPCVAQVQLTVAVGTHSAKEMPDKLSRLGVPIFTAPGQRNTSVLLGWSLGQRVSKEPRREIGYRRPDHPGRGNGSCSARPAAQTERDACGGRLQPCQRRPAVQ